MAPATPRPRAHEPRDRRPPRARHPRLPHRPRRRPRRQGPPRALPRKRADHLLALLYARGYRRGRLAADLPMPADTIRDELTENPHMSSTPDTVDVEPPKTREGNGYPHAARTPQ